MKTYLVGGAVRDIVMGVEPKDRDYVVVGATPEEMLRQGFKQVGADFPVFLHPETGDEYALARYEKKVGEGYNGFETFHSPTVTLDQDLFRRDLTMNSMAMDSDGSIIDPYGGQKDSAARTIRHPSDAFVEDPVRVLRVARFLARYPRFRVCNETNTLMTEISNSGELDSLTPERVFKETFRAMGEAAPNHFFSSLIRVDALFRIFPYMEGSDILQSLSALMSESSAGGDAHSCFVTMFGSLACSPDWVASHGGLSRDLVADMNLARRLHESIHVIPFRSHEYLSNLLLESGITRRDDGAERALSAVMSMCGRTLEIRNIVSLIRACVRAWKETPFQPEWESAPGHARGDLMMTARRDAVARIITNYRIHPRAIA